MHPRRSIVALLASFLASTMASTMLDTVLGIQVFAISGRPLDLGLLGLAESAPVTRTSRAAGSRRRRCWRKP